MRKVLFVDDNVDYLIVIKHNFRNFSDINLDTTTDPFEAINLVEKNDYSLCILDFMLGYTDGYLLAKEIKGKKPNQKIILLTGYRKEHIESRYPDVYKYIDEIYLKDVVSTHWVTSILNSQINNKTNEKILELIEGTQRIALHDINNTLALVIEQYDVFISNLNNIELKNKIRKGLYSLVTYISLLREETTVFRLTDAIEMAVEEAKAKYPGKIFVTMNEENLIAKTNMAYLVSLLRNLIDNAYEAAKRRDILNDLKIEIEVNRNSIVLRDNAKGFNIKKIGNGSSKQENGHGVALDSFIKSSIELGIRLDIYSKEGIGTDILITIPEFKS